MKSILFAASALVIAASAAHAAGDRGATAPTAQGERTPGLDRERMAPVMLRRDPESYQNPPSPTDAGAMFGTWTGNENEG